MDAEKSKGHSVVRRCRPVLSQPEPARALVLQPVHAGMLDLSRPTILTLGPMQTHRKCPMRCVPCLVRLF